MSHRSITKRNAPYGVTESLQRLGANIVLARKRRELREVDLADVAGITRHTLQRVQAGNPGTSIGAYIAVVRALGFHRDLWRVGDPGRDTYDGLPEEIANRIKRTHAPPDLLDWDWGDAKRGRKEERVRLDERRAPRRAARRTRKEMAARQERMAQEAVEALMAGPAGVAHAMRHLSWLAPPDE